MRENEGELRCGAGEYNGNGGERMLNMVSGEARNIPLGAFLERGYL